MRIKMCGKLGSLLKTILSMMIMFFLTAEVFADVKLRTEADVAAYSDKITGFNFIKGIKKEFKREVITDDNTPFLHKQIKGRNVWVAEYKDFKLELKSVLKDDKYKRNFKVYIDPNDGTLLKITSKFEGFDPNFPKAPSAATVERLSKGVSYSFPKEPPKISFLDALDAAQTGMPSNPLEAKEIEGLYVWYSNPLFQARRVWIILTRGQPSYPMIGFGPDIPNRSEPNLLEERKKREGKEEWFRVFIDADTGNAIFGDNALRPEEPEKK